MLMMHVALTSGVGISMEMTQETLGKVDKQRTEKVEPPAVSLFLDYMTCDTWVSSKQCRLCRIKRMEWGLQQEKRCLELRMIQQRQKKRCLEWGFIQQRE